MSAIGNKLRKLEGGCVAFWCPGCQEVHTIAVEAPARYVWGWNGSLDAPTFTPSVLMRSGHYAEDKPRGNCWCDFAERLPEQARRLAEWRNPPRCMVCHSFVTNDQIQFLSDCTHELAGQTVPLPDFPGADDE